MTEWANQPIIRSTQKPEKKSSKIKLHVLAKPDNEIFEEDIFDMDESLVEDFI